MQPNYQPDQTNPLAAAQNSNDSYRQPEGVGSVGAKNTFGRIVEYIMLFVAIIATGSLLSGNVFLLQFTISFFVIVAAVYIMQSQSRRGADRTITTYDANGVAVVVPRKQKSLLVKVLIGMLVIITAVVIGFVGMIMFFIILLAASGV